MPYKPGAEIFLNGSCANRHESGVIWIHLVSPAEILGELTVKAIVQIGKSGKIDIESAPTKITTGSILFFYIFFGNAVEFSQFGVCVPVTRLFSLSFRQFKSMKVCPKMARFS